MRWKKPESICKQGWGDFWPEFANAGKDHLTLAHVLSHRAGLCALDSSSATLLDHESVIRAVESQVPLRGIDDGPAYGPRVFGFILDEIVRRLSGERPLDPIGAGFSLSLWDWIFGLDCRRNFIRVWPRCSHRVFNWEQLPMPLLSLLPIRLHSRAAPFLALQDRPLRPR